jgi:excisionase family DNA binding protein
MLDISRPTLMKLIGEGEILAYKVGTHTRLKSSDVIVYQERLRAEQRAAFDDLRAFEDAEGMTYRPVLGVHKDPASFLVG